MNFCVIQFTSLNTITLEYRVENTRERTNNVLHNDRYGTYRCNLILTNTQNGKCDVFLFACWSAQQIHACYNTKRNVWGRETDRDSEMSNERTIRNRLNTANNKDTQYDLYTKLVSNAQRLLASSNWETREKERTTSYWVKYKHRVRDTLKTFIVVRNSLVLSLFHWFWLVSYVCTFQFTYLLTLIERTFPLNEYCVFKNRINNKRTYTHVDVKRYTWYENTKYTNWWEQKWDKTFPFFQTKPKMVFWKLEFIRFHNKVKLEKQFRSFILEKNDFFPFLLSPVHM